MANIDGTGGDDVLEGTAGDDLIRALPGNDSIAGRGGNDILLGDSGDDSAFLNVSTDGADRIELGSGADAVSVTANFAGQVRLTFRAAQVGDGSTQDVAAGGAELALQLQAENGADGLAGPLSRSDDEGITFVAGPGLSFDVRDPATGARRGDIFTAATLGTSGDDLLRATLAGRSYYIDGGSGGDLITGGATSDLLAGGAGIDVFVISGGLDIVLGGDAFDTVTYGAGVGRGDGAVVRDANAVATGFRPADGSGLTSWATVERVVFADGAVDYFTDSLAIGVAHLYRGLLGREADPLGLSFQLDTIEQSGDLLAVASNLAASAESAAQRAGLSTAAVVDRAYAGILGRSADAGGLAFWTAELDSGRTSVAGLATSLVASPEFDLGLTGIAGRGVAYTEYDAILIQTAYRTLLGRNAEAAGLAFYNEGIDAGRLPLTGILDLFTRSPEFLAGDGALSDAAFVDRLYDRVFERDGEAAGTAYYADVLAAGVTRGVVAQNFLISPEADAQRAVLATNGLDLF